MDGEGKTEFGFPQVGKGFDPSVRWKPMGKRRASQEDRELLLTIIAENVRRLMERDYEKASNRAKALHADSGVGVNTINRILAKGQAPRVDILLKLAAAFDEPIWRLFVRPDSISRVFDTSGVPDAPRTAAVMRDLKRQRD